ncbi:MAG: hypothetical protein IJI98_06495 [Methanosphaera sp.]|nr:hypothetical protein [Methanosphaera sp.]
MINKKKITIIILIIIISMTLIGVYYLNQYYPTEIDIAKYNNTDVQLVKTSNGLLLDGPGNSNVLIFYPGAKIEYTAYVPLLYKLSEEGIDCMLIQMPYNLALLDKDAADIILKNNTYDYKNWYLAGHSLGGSMAAEYTKGHETNITGLILLASYSTSKISTPSLSIYGSEDKVLNMDNYQKNKKNLEKINEYQIRGGNHAQYAYYGKQEKDGEASITTEEQIGITSKEIIKFVNETSQSF